jgi:hypothetical protein
MFFRSVSNTKLLANNNSQSNYSGQKVYGSVSTNDPDDDINDIRPLSKKKIRLRRSSFGIDKSKGYVVCNYT